MEHFTTSSPAYGTALYLRTLRRHNRGDPGWMLARKQGKDKRRVLTDALQSFETYAEEKGSRNLAKNVYSTFTRLVYKNILGATGYKQGRDVLAEYALLFLSGAEHIAAGVIVRGMAQDKGYKEIYADTKQQIEALGTSLGDLRFPIFPQLKTGATKFTRTTDRSPIGNRT